MFYMQETDGLSCFPLILYHTFNWQENKEHLNEKDDTILTKQKKFYMQEIDSLSFFLESYAKW